MKLSDRERIVGCIRGKAIGGTLGAPVEGRMEQLHLTYYDPVPTGVLPNDDFDIQLLFLEAVENAGGLVDSSRLAKAWGERMTFPFDEYGVATLNLKRGLKPPVTGWFDNPFKNCMGCPIRSELWALLAPGRPRLAAFFALQDARIDHAGESIAGEMFFSALEAMAFSGGDDFLVLITTALKTIDSKTQTACALRFVLANYRQLAWPALRQGVLDKFGHPNFTEAPQNIAFTIFGLLYFPDDFEKALLCTTNCGYDTDCTAATIGAIWGLVNGDRFPESWTKPIGSRVLASHGVRDMALPVTVDALAAHILRVRKLVEARYAGLSEAGAARKVREQLADLSQFKPDLNASLTVSGAPVLNGTTSLKFSGKLRAVHARYPVKATVSRNTIRVSTAPGRPLPSEVRLTLESSSGRFHDMALVTPHELWKVESDTEEKLLRMAYWPGADKAFRPLMLPERTFFLNDVASRKWLLLRGFLHLAAEDKYRLGVYAECPARAWLDGALLMNRKNPAPCIPAPHRGLGGRCRDLELSAGWHRWDVLLHAGDPIREGKVCLVVAHAYTQQLIDYRFRRDTTGVYDY
jgi:ADP-ribosylglycohydrolase